MSPTRRVARSEWATTTSTSSTSAIVATATTDVARFIGGDGPIYEGAPPTAARAVTPSGDQTNPDSQPHSHVQANAPTHADPQRGLDLPAPDATKQTISQRRLMLNCRV